MRNIQKVETLEVFQSIPLYSQLVSAIGIELLNPRNEAQDKSSEIYQEQLKEYQAALEKLNTQLEKIKEYNFT